MANRVDREEEWFLKQEKETLVHGREKRDRDLKALHDKLDSEEQEKLREKHWLKCPKCGHDMKTIKIDHIEIEQCELCEGLYFDRGEFDMMLLREKTQRFKFFRRFFGLE